jgi:hypothetical protein
LGRLRESRSAIGETPRAFLLDLEKNSSTKSATEKKMIGAPSSLHRSATAPLTAEKAPRSLALVGPRQRTIEELAGRRPIMGSHGAFISALHSSWRIAQRELG